MNFGEGDCKTVSLLIAGTGTTVEGQWTWLTDVQAQGGRDGHGGGREAQLLHSTPLASRGQFRNAIVVGEIRLAKCQQNLRAALITQRSRQQSRLGL